MQKLAEMRALTKSLTDQQWQNTTFFAATDLETMESLYQENQIDNLSYSVNSSITQRLGKRFFMQFPKFHTASSDETLVRTQGILTPSDAIVDSLLSPTFSRNYDRIRPGLTIKRSTKQVQINLFLKSEFYKNTEFSLGR